MYFMSKMRPNKWNPDYPYDHLKENISRYDIICGIGDDAHFAPDYEMGVRLGWGGLVERIEHWKKVNTTPEQQHFYALHLRVIRAVQGWIQRHVDEARRLAATCGDPEKKALLTELADMNERIISDAPATMREACQWIIWFHRRPAPTTATAPGDRSTRCCVLSTNRNKANGILDDETAVYYLACLLINDPIYWQLGGPDASGRDPRPSHISFLVLEASDKINTSLNLTVRVHDGLVRSCSENRWNTW